MAVATKVTAIITTTNHDISWPQQRVQKRCIYRGVLSPQLEKEFKQEFKGTSVGGDLSLLVSLYADMYDRTWLDARHPSDLTSRGKAYLPPNRTAFRTGMSSLSSH
jgi:hypothetical protein